MAIRKRQQPGDRADGGTGSANDAPGSAPSGSGGAAHEPGDTDTNSAARTQDTGATPAARQHDIDVVSSDPSPLRGTDTQGGPRAIPRPVAAIVAISAVVVLVAVLRTDPNGEILRLADTACTQAETWQADSNAGAGLDQLNIDAAAYKKTLAKLYEAANKLSLSNETRDAVVQVASDIYFPMLPVGGPSSHCRAMETALRAELTK